jgi:hypothetical protein
MEERIIVDSRFSAVINTPLEKVDIPVWSFSLPDEECQECSPAHIAAGSTTARDGRGMSIIAELVGGSLNAASPRSQFCVRPQVWLGGAKPLPAT